jgi:hypothetical protein
MPEDSDAYPEYADEHSKSEWDARQIYARTLEELDNRANEIKMRIELHQYKREEIGEMFGAYLSVLRCMFRKLYPLFDKKGAAKIEKNIDELKAETDGNLQKQLTEDNIYPQETEDGLEKLHNELNGRRFSRGLVVPMSAPRDESGVDGWQGSG